MTSRLRLLLEVYVELRKMKEGVQGQRKNFLRRVFDGGWDM
jgi:hypothetical protein